MLAVKAAKLLRKGKDEGYLVNIIEKKNDKKSPIVKNDLGVFPEDMVGTQIEFTIDLVGIQDCILNSPYERFMKDLGKAK